MTHPNENLIRKYVGAAQKNDVETLRTILHDDVVMHFFGHNPVAGVHEGREATWKRLGETWGPRKLEFKINEIVDLLVNDDRAVLLMKVQISGPEKTVHLNRADVYRIVDGKIVELWVYDDDPYKVDELFADGAPTEVKYTGNTIKLGEGQLSPPAKVADVAWIAGHYTGQALAGEFEVAWVAPHGEGMMGMFKHVRDADGKINFYELLTLTEDSGSLLLRVKHFSNELKGLEERDESVTCRLVKLTKDAAYFEGLTFQKPSVDSLQVFAGVEQDGKVVELEFTGKRVHKKIGETNKLRTL